MAVPTHGVALAAELVGDSPCLRMARERMDGLAGKRADRVAWYAASSCSRSRAVLAGSQGASPELREQICRREVLAGSFTKTCVYFRDVLCPEVYEPCADWVREQYARCVAGDLEWFQPVGQTGEGDASQQ